MIENEYRNVSPSIQMNAEYREILDEKLREFKVSNTRVVDAILNRIVSLGWTSKYAAKDSKLKDRESRDKKSIITSRKDLLEKVSELSEPYQIPRNNLIKDEVYGIILGKGKELGENIEDLKKYFCTKEFPFADKLYINRNFHINLEKVDICYLINYICKRIRNGELDIHPYLFNDEKVREVVSTTRIDNADILSISDSVNNIHTLAGENLVDGRDMMYAIMEYIRVNPIVVGEFITYTKKISRPMKISIGKDVKKLLDKRIKQGKIKNYDEYLYRAFSNFSTPELTREIKAKISNKDTKKEMAIKHDMITTGIPKYKLQLVDSFRSVYYLSWVDMVDSLVKLEFLRERDGK